MRPWALWLALAQVGDVATTWHGLSHSLASEGNPIALLVLRLGLPGLLTAKAIATTTFLTIAHHVHTTHPALALRGVRMATCGMGAIVAWNLHLLIQ